MSKTVIEDNITLVTKKLLNTQTRKYSDGSGDINPSYTLETKSYNEALKTLCRALVDIEYVKN